MKIPLLHFTTHHNTTVLADYTEVSFVEELRGSQGSRIGLKSGATFEVIETSLMIQGRIRRAYEEEERSHLRAKIEAT